jgi:hypothetical protein
LEFGRLVFGGYDFVNGGNILTTFNGHSALTIMAVLREREATEDPEAAFVGIWGEPTMERPREARAMIPFRLFIVLPRCIDVF